MSKQEALMETDATWKRQKETDWLKMENLFKNI